MMRFETDLQVVRASPADGEIGLSASRWALAEAAIVADISAAVASAEVMGPHRRTSAVTSLTPSRTEGGKGTYG